MRFRLLDAPLVAAIHNAVLNPGALPGLARDTSRDRALARIDNRLAYGMIADALIWRRPMRSRWRRGSVLTMPTRARRMRRW
ncbi:MAG: hypothetical protein AAFQ19_07810 [Pseudomonadota bacterium]